MNHQRYPKYPKSYWIGMVALVVSIVVNLYNNWALDPSLAWLSVVCMILSIAAVVLLVVSIVRTQTKMRKKQ